MQNVFLVLGYGVPRNILQDTNYLLYLTGSFNKIYDLVIKNKIANPVIIFCGGRTDCWPPYKRNEAEEMLRVYKKLANRPFLKKTTKNWLALVEKKSLSTLENFLFAKDIFCRKKISSGQVNIFCEATREPRVKITAGLVFGKKFKIKPVVIDFDHSQNRYLDPEFIERKEQAGIKLARWSLKSQENLKEHHDLFARKIKFLRSSDARKHPAAVEEWFRKELAELERRKII